MTDDRRLQHLLRAALPPAADHGPSRDLWPLVVSRIQAPMRRSWLDMSLAAAVAVVLLLFPEWLLVLAYHL
jgi:hypothetical protein